MSKLDDYKTAKAEHETICEIIATCKPSIGEISQQSSGHHIGFLFCLPGTGLTYRKRLATMLGKACEAKLDELIGAAERFSEVDVAEKAQAAQDEAIETLKTVKVENRDESCPNA